MPETYGFFVAGYLSLLTLFFAAMGYAIWQLKAKK